MEVREWNIPRALLGALLTVFGFWAQGGRAAALAAACSRFSVPKDRRFCT